MTDAPKLLTEAEWRNVLSYDKDIAVQYIGERGLIAPEPVDPLLIEAREICARYFDEQNLPAAARSYRSGKNDNEGDIGECELPIALAALRRGMELAPAASPLTREMVAQAYWSATGADTVKANLIDRLHAAILKQMQL